MKKLLLASVAVGGLAFAAPVHAGLDLQIGGFFSGYGAFVNQDEDAAGVLSEVNGFNMLRDTELYFTGETTLDNGLTVGADIQITADRADTSNSDVSFVYFSGDWGRLNMGAEDGAAHLLQVSAPSADDNIDGVRQFIQPFETTGGLTAAQLDYDNSPAGTSDKFTYFSPIMNGFQLGLSLSPETDSANDLTGVDFDNEEDDIGETYEIAVRYEGMFQNVGVIAGAGYSTGEVELDADNSGDDREVWNVGLDLDIGPFGIGAIFMDDNTGSNTVDREIMVLGADYTTGPFKIGVSYYNNDLDQGIEYDRYTAGVIYEYGPGLTFRGSIQQLEQDNVAGADADGTALLLGTVINF